MAAQPSETAPQTKAAHSRSTTKTATTSHGGKTAEPRRAASFSDSGHFTLAGMYHTALAYTPAGRRAGLDRAGRVQNASYRTMRYSSHGMSCVPFARLASGIDVKGNAANWWDNSVGLYARGNRPEAGSVLDFRATGRMRLGHVAVVTNVLDSRTVVIDHANWAGGGIARGVPVVDVSERNDWTAVRVGLGRGGDYGSVYPTYGFIYGRPDHEGFMTAGAARPAPAVEIAEAPSGAVYQPASAVNHSLR